MRCEDSSTHGKGHVSPQCTLWPGATVLHIQRNEMSGRSERMRRFFLTMVWDDAKTKLSYAIKSWIHRSMVGHELFFHRSEDCTKFPPIIIPQILFGWQLIVPLILCAELVTIPQLVVGRGFGALWFAFSPALAGTSPCFEPATPFFAKCNYLVWRNFILYQIVQSCRIPADDFAAFTFFLVRLAIVDNYAE